MRRRATNALQTLGGAQAFSFLSMVDSRAIRLNLKHNLSPSRSQPSPMDLRKHAQGAVIYTNAPHAPTDAGSFPSLCLCRVNYGHGVPSQVCFHWTAHERKLTTTCMCSGPGLPRMSLPSGRTPLKYVPISSEWPPGVDVEAGIFPSQTRVSRWTSPAAGHLV